MSIVRFWPLPESSFCQRVARVVGQSLLADADAVCGSQLAAGGPYYLRPAATVFRKLGLMAACVFQ